MDAERFVAEENFDRNALTAEAGAVGQPAAYGAPAGVLEIGQRPQDRAKDNMPRPTKQVATVKTAVKEPKPIAPQVLEEAAGETALGDWGEEYHPNSAAMPGVLIRRYRSVLDPWRYEEEFPVQPGDVNYGPQKDRAIAIIERAFNAGRVGADYAAMGDFDKSKRLRVVVELY